MITEEVIFTFKATSNTPKKFSYATVKSSNNSSANVEDKKTKYSNYKIDSNLYFLLLINR